jgi:hypothetical protein
MADLRVVNRQMDAFFHIDRENRNVVMIPTREGDLDDYINTLTTSIINDERSRHFYYESDTKEIAVLINQIVQSPENPDLFLKNAEAIASRLLRTELETQTRQGDFSELQKGSLIVSKYSEGVNYNFFISKVEHESFLNTEELVKQNGVPYEKGTLKTCLLQVDNETGEVIDVIVTDSNTKISKYWYESFLELTEIQDDDRNTKLSFNAMDQFLGRKLKRKSPVDYTHVRNHLITYYRGQVDFDFNNMLQTVFGRYTPEDPDVDIDGLKEEARSLPENKKFDRVFTINESVIRARIRKVHKLNSVSEIRIIGGATDFSNLIKAKKEGGDNILEIKVEDEETFKYFYSDSGD